MFDQVDFSEVCRKAGQPPFAMAIMNNMRATIKRVGHIEFLKKMSVHWGGLVVIWNRGVHFTVDGQLLRHLRATADTLEHIFPAALSIFRSTSMNHGVGKACHGDAAHMFPSPTLPELVDMPEKPQWHAKNATTQSRLVVESYFKTRQRGTIFLDILTPQAYRWDMHTDKDCLHYCVPGPQDLWVKMTLATIHLLDLLAVGGVGGGKS